MQVVLAREEASLANQGGRGGARDSKRRGDKTEAAPAHQRTLLGRTTAGARISRRFPKSKSRAGYIRVPTVPVEAPAISLSPFQRAHGRGALR